MSYCASYAVPFTTDGSGDATVYTGVRVVGRVLLIVYTHDDALTGADFTITGRTTGTAILTITDAGTSDIQWAPRQATCDTVGAASLYAAAGEPVEDHIWIAEEELQIVVAQGGATKSGILTFIVG